MNSKKSIIKTSGTKNHKQYVCPCCGSRRGLSLMGLRSATEISASISQMFASKFNDDKKTLAFSDNVQDAAHRAGFFNSRTWRFGLRTAIQKYCTEIGSGKNLADFQNGFIKYWHEHMTDEQFVSFFIAPNLTWKQAYEDMVEKRSLGKDKQAQILVYEVEQRIKYEIMLEFGLAGNIGRTLEKSNCSVISFATEDIIRIADAVQERTINELGVLTAENSDSFKRMVIGYLNLMRTNGAFEDKVFDEYTMGDGNGYMLSNDRNRWLPGRQSGRNTPRFIAEHIGNGRSLSLLEPALMKNNLAFNNWEMIVKAVNDQTHFTNANFVFLGTIFGSWIPRTSNAHLAIHSAILASELKAEGAVAVCAVLNDEKDRRTDKYEQEWNGLWRFYRGHQSCYLRVHSQIKIESLTA